MNTDLIDVQRNTELGRYAVLRQDVLAGDILFEEYPFVIGPKTNSPPLCLACYRPITGNRNGSRCPVCKWPLCVECIETAAASVHGRECELFVQNKILFHNAACTDEAPCLQLDFITPLRLLLEKESNPERWNREISQMEYHATVRQNSAIWQADEINVVGYMHGPCKLRDRFSKDLIRQACGILEINSFEARTKYGHSIRCIFPKTAIMAHSCVPNTMHSILPSEDFKIKVRAAVDIGKGELAYSTYTYTLSGTLVRQSHLKSGKYFTCHCQRCLDPIELGTHFSSVICRKCSGGLIASLDPLDENAEWKCSNCEFRTVGGAVQKAVAVIQSEVDELNEQEFSISRLERTEKLLQKYSLFLYKDHHILISLCQILIEMYGRVNGYELKHLQEHCLQRKRDLCTNVLRLVSIFQPGRTRARALLLYELHGPMVIMAKKAFINGTLTGNEFKLYLMSAREILQESNDILCWEDETSHEGKIAAISKKILIQLEHEILSI